MKNTISYKNGNSLSYADYGDENGDPILIQHGLIASINDHHLFERLIQSGRRLICIARPGYGDSSPYELKDIAEWGEIVSVLVDELRLPQFDVLGISSGAPYSYAIGYQFQDRVRNLFILSGIPALYDEGVRSFWPYAVQKNPSIAGMQKLAYEIFFSDLSEEDLENEDVKDSMMHHCFGIAQDLKIRCQDWGFRLSEVRNRTFMRHSRSDQSVPWRTAEMTARLLPDCRFELRKNDAHFSSQILDDFLCTTIIPHCPQRNQKSG